jgi:hypothetical protein
VVLEADERAFIVIGHGHHTVGGTYQQVFQDTDDQNK